jgi:isoamylase
MFVLHCEQVRTVIRSGVSYLAPQVEFCFTAEGDDSSSRLISLRGLDSPLYYRPSGLLSLAQPIVRRLVLDAIRHWACTYGVDGFVLLSAEAMAQDSGGAVLDCPALAEEIAADGAVRGGACKIVAWPRDYRLLPREGRRGFPHAGVLMQHNGRFGAVLEWLKSGDGALLTSVASLLTGASCFRPRYHEC